MLTPETLFRILCAALNLSPASRAAQRMIRAAYQSESPTPEPPRSEDRVYYHLAPDPSSPAFPEETRTEQSATGLFRYAPYVLTLTFYGPSAESNAFQVRSRLYQDGQGNPLSLLRAEGAYPIPCPPAPRLLFEPSAALWRGRADLSIPLRVATAVDLPNTPTVAVAPRIAVYTAARFA